ncbi:hypothetical protein HRbin36_01706 [bacterium HR36]|nr:hypothetical protein HRbin36_01706 [bacterium HR36]
MPGRFWLSGLIVIAVSGCAGHAAPEQMKVRVTDPVEVAPKVSGTRAQTWASAAWSETARAWLVAWREGCLNEDGTEIWCARIAADGTSLDPAGIRIATGKGLRSEPKVASDGQDWLVVWADACNGKDWDVYACLVAQDGQIRGKPFVLAGGEHNQCQPSVAFASGSYHVVWAAFSGSGLPNTPGTGYSLFATRLSREGKPLTAQPVELTSNRYYQASHPCIAASGDTVVVVFMETTFIKWGKNFLNFLVLDGQSGQRKAGPLPPSKGNNNRSLGNKVTARWSPVAGSGGKFLTLVRDVESFGGRNPYAATLWAIAPTGSLSKTSVEIDGLMSKTAYYAPAHVALASDEEHFLLVMESLRPADARKTSLTDRSQMGIVGWLLAAGDTPRLVHGNSKGGFPIAIEAGKDIILPAVCAGPRSTFLVVASELRGLDDIKLTARLVKVTR